MKSGLICIPCVINQLKRTARKAGVKEEKIAKYVERAIAKVGELSLDDPPNLFTTKILKVLYEEIKKDPYKEEKEKQNNMVKEILPKVKNLIKNSKDPIYTSLLFSSLGNIIDVGPKGSFKFNEILEGMEKKRFDIDDYPVLKKKLKNAKTLLYLLDNAGEVLFDKIVLENLAITDYRLAAKESPILNDVTTKEVEKLGFPAEKIVSSGSVLGVDFKTADKEFIEWYHKSDIIIAKGHANFESLIDKQRPVFFLLKVKCKFVGDYINAKVGDSVLLYYSP